MLVMVILGVVVVIVVVLLVVMGMRESGKQDALQARLEEFAERGEAANLEDIELSQPLRDRIILPIARSLGELALKFTPQNAIQGTSRKLELAGNPRGLDPTIFLAMRMAGISLGVLLLGFAPTAPEGGFLKGKGILYETPAGPLGFFLPELWLSSKITRRQNNIRKAMPD